MAKKTKDLSLTKKARTDLYAARRYLQGKVQEDLGLRIPFDVYFQDPAVSASNPAFDFDGDFVVPWEPGFGHGPTSARFVVVDYDGGTETLAAPAQWNEKLRTFVDDADLPLDRTKKGTLQFHQVNVWATLQYALDFFENGFGLGRRILWGFEGNRLIVVPHAGYGENAYYDRESKSLQFYYFDREGSRIHTCLSADIINHEFGHAVLDGLRPFYNESVLPETAAFHEFMGDLTAILIAFRNTPFRHQLVAATGGDLDSESALSSIAEEFGRYTKDRPYLRSARNDREYAAVVNDPRPHYMSEVLTGAMFDILRKLCRYYIDVRGRTVAEAFWATIQRMQNMAIQPLDLLPPVDVTFKDYARAVLRAERIADPADLYGYQAMMLDVFAKRGILDEDDHKKLSEPDETFHRLELDVFHDAATIASSRADAYRFLDDNRKSLFIPYGADVIVADLSIAQKFTQEARRQPRQVLLQYIWREDVDLKGPQFGQYDGKTASFLCGGTLALSENGDVLAWERKPGTRPLLGNGQDDKDETAAGEKRRDRFLAALARRIAQGRISNPIGGGGVGLLEKSIAPLTSREIDGTVRFHLSPHIGIHDDKDDEMGGRQWQISS